MSHQSENFLAFADRFLTTGTCLRTRKAYAELARSVELAVGTPDVFETSEGVLVFAAKGAVKLVAHASMARQQVIAFYFAGDTFIMPANGPHGFSLHALSDSEMLVFPYARFTELAHDECEILRHLLDRNALSLQRSREKTIALGRKTALERVAGFLIAMCERIGTARGSHIEIALPMSRRDIADSLGLTIETVSRQFSHLRKIGVVETHGRSRVTVFSLDALDGQSGTMRHAA